MPQATFHFPRGFLWGTATSSHQVEGNNTNNNWWSWENQPGRILNDEKSGLACDWWNGRWKEDFDRAVEMGQNAHRFSIEWSRVQPAPDRWDENALDRYRDMLRGLIDRNLTPIVCLHHFSNPLWVEEKGGWENPEIINWFIRYVSKIVEAVKEYTSMWLTINEPNVLLTCAYASNEFPPGKNSRSSTIHALNNLVQAHAGAYRSIHKSQPQARVGITINVRPFNPYRAWSPLDHWSAKMINSFFNESFIGALTTGKIHLPFYKKRVHEVRNTLDFLGINYFTRQQVSFYLLKAKDLFGRRFFSKELELSDTGFLANDPPGIFQVIKWGRKFNLPMIITENGIEDADDHIRPGYLIQHLHQVWRAVNFNWQVKGYFHWTLVDNFEWERGWTQRFGLWELDVETQVRKKRPSADLYAEICRENGISTEMVEKYCPAITKILFPD
jgi:beta-glucosidase